MDLGLNGDVNGYEGYVKPGVAWVAVYAITIQHERSSASYPLRCRASTQPGPAQAVGSRRISAMRSDFRHRACRHLRYALFLLVSLLLLQG